MHKSRESLDKQQEAQMGYDPLLAAGNLNKGDHFRLRKNGKWYTVHELVKAVRHNDTCFNGDHYIIAVCSKQRMWIHSATKVFVCC